MFANLKYIAISNIQHALQIQSLKFWPFIDPEKSLTKIALIISQLPTQSPGHASESVVFNISLDTQ